MNFNNIAAGYIMKRRDFLIGALCMFILLPLFFKPLDDLGVFILKIVGCMTIIYFIKNS